MRDRFAGIGFLSIGGWFFPGIIVFWRGFVHGGFLLFKGCLGRRKAVLFVVIARTILIAPSLQDCVSRPACLLGLFTSCGSIGIGVDG